MTEKERDPFDIEVEILPPGSPRVWDPDRDPGIHHTDEEGETEIGDEDHSPFDEEAEE